MEFLPLYALLVLCLPVKGYAEPIQCYYCDDCTTLNDTLLYSCPRDKVEPTTATTEETTTTTEETTTVAEETTTKSEETTTDDPTIITELNNLEAVEADATQGEGPESPSASFRNAKDYKLLSILSRKSRQVTYESVMTRSATGDTVIHQCYSIEREVEEKRKIEKGCIEVPKDKEACKVIKDKYGIPDAKCKSCSSDKCNSSDALKYSLVTLVFIVMIYLLC